MFVKEGFVIATTCIFYNKTKDCLLKARYFLTWALSPFAAMFV